MMDILYIVGNGSDWDDNELRYSLRSIAKNGRNLGRVFLVGHKPKWVSDQVTHIPCDDPLHVKHKNILNKVLTAMEKSDIGQHFLISSDDHYYVQPTDFDNLPVYFKNIEIPARMTDAQVWQEYFKSLHDTRCMLERHGLTLYQTNPHCNTHWDRGVYNRHRAIFDECMAMQFGGEMNCVMGNLLILEGADPQPFVDAKLSTKMTLAEIEQAAKTSNCLSSTPNIRESALAEYLRKTFPTKCKYEI